MYVCCECLHTWDVYSYVLISSFPLTLGLPFLFNRRTEVHPKTVFDEIKSEDRTIEQLSVSMNFMDRTDNRIGQRLLTPFKEEADTMTLFVVRQTFGYYGRLGR